MGMTTVDLRHSASVLAVTGDLGMRKAAAGCWLAITELRKTVWRCRDDHDGMIRGCGGARG